MLQNAPVLWLNGGNLTTGLPSGRLVIHPRELSITFKLHAKDKTRSNLTTNFGKERVKQKWIKQNRPKQVCQGLTRDVRLWWWRLLAVCLSVCFSVRVSVRLHETTRTYFHEVCYFGIFPKIGRENSSWNKSDKNNRYSIWTRVYICDIISPTSWEMFQTKVFEKIKIYLMFSRLFFNLNVTPFMR